MPTRAISSFGVQLRLGDGVLVGSPITIAVATATTPIVLTLLSSHTIVDVGMVTVTGCTTMPSANGTWIAQRGVDALHLILRGSVGSGGGGSNGLVQVTETYTTIAEVTNIQDAGLSTTLVDVTAHDAQNGYGSNIPTFLRGNTMRVDFNLVPAHPTHNKTTGLLSLALNRLSRRFLIVFPDTVKTAWAFSAFVTQDYTQTPVAGALVNNAQLEVDGAMLLSAA